jgi:hypothetical protein
MSFNKTNISIKRNLFLKTGYVFLIKSKFITIFTQKFQTNKIYESIIVN